MAHEDKEAGGVIVDATLFDCLGMGPCCAECYRRHSIEIGLTINRFVRIYIYIYIRKSVGEITEPWGTPAFVGKDSHDIPFATTLILLFVRKRSIHL